LCQNATWHSSQTSSCSGILSIKIRMDDRSASGQSLQTLQSSSLTDGSPGSLRFFIRSPSATSTQPVDATQPVDLTLIAMHVFRLGGATVLALEELFQTSPKRYAATLGIVHDFQKRLIEVPVRWSSPLVSRRLVQRNVFSGQLAHDLA
jgi:hypothetical protein